MQEALDMEAAVGMEVAAIAKPELAPEHAVQRVPSTTDCLLIETLSGKLIE